MLNGVSQRETYEFLGIEDVGGFWMGHVQIDV